MMRTSMESTPAKGGEHPPPTQPARMPAKSVFPNDLVDPSDGRSNQAHAGKCSDVDDTAPEALPTSRSIDPAQLDWHTEMLCGLFLRSNEQELAGLEHSVPCNKTGGGPELQASPQSQTPSKIFYCPSEGGQCQVASGGEMEPLINENNAVENDAVLREKPQSNQGQVQQPLDNLLNGLLHLEQTLDSTVLSLIPEALQGIPSIPHDVEPPKMKSSGGVGNQGGDIKLGDASPLESTKQSKMPESCLLEPTKSISASKSFGETEEAQGKHQDPMADEKTNIDCSSPADADADGPPLCVPSSWRRSGYARRTLPELEQHVIDSDSGVIRGNMVSGHHSKSTKKGASPPNPLQGPKTYNLVSLLYNECSLTAMANWAMLDFSPSEANDEDSKKEWGKFVEKEEKRRLNDQTQYDVIIPNPTFHLCGVCGGFGHYEVECELILDSDKSSGKDSTEQDLDTSGPNPKKKRKVLDESGGEVLFGEKEKDLVISSLSKEIHIQRRQKALFENHCKECALTDPVTGLANQVQGIEDQYTGKSSFCKICHSGLDDGMMILCDGCDELFHCQCLDPPLDSIPEGDWFCPNCTSYDSDVSSIVDIEGDGDFVIEQRKCSVAEGERLACGVNLGQTKSLWTTALSILPQQDPVVRDEVYLEKHLGREYGHVEEDFFLSELCWAKRFNDQLGRVEWWPAMVTDSDTRLLKSSKKTTYSVVFFALDIDADFIHETEILPFLSYYEDIGHKRLKIRDDDTFRRALILAVSTLGLKSLGQALKLARDGVQMAAVMNSESRKLLPPGWTIPVGWDSAEIDKIDGIVILAKEGGNQSPEKLSRKASSSASSALGGGDLAQESSEGDKMVAQFCIDEVIGGIVSWQSDFGPLYSKGNSDIRYGLVVSIDTATSMALVQAIPMLSNVTPGHQLFRNDDSSNGLLIYATDLGSTTWIPLRHIRFVSGKPARRDLRKFKKRLSSNMKHELSSYSEKSKREARYREEFTIELEDIPPDQHPW